MKASPGIGSADVRAFAMLNMSNWSEYEEIKPIKSKRMITDTARLNKLLVKIKWVIIGT